MKRKILLLTSILVFLFSRAYSYQNIINIPDSLKKYTYEDLVNKFVKNHTNKELSIIYIQTLLQKGKNENNSNQTAYGYWRLGSIYSHYDDSNLAHKYLDSCIDLSRKKNLNHILARSYFTKADLYNISNEYRKELDFFLKAEKYYNKSNTEMGYLLSYNIGKLKYKLGEYEDALNLFKKVQSYEVKKGAYTKDKRQYLNTLYYLANAYSSNNLRDSTSIVIDEAYIIAKSLKDSTYITFTFLEGGNQFYKGNYQEAQDSLHKAIPYLEKNNIYTELFMGYYFLGSIHQLKNQQSLAIKYYKKVDSLFVKYKLAIPDIRGTYENLIQYSKRENNILDQLHYTKQLLLMDSLVSEEYKYYSKKFYKDYDTPKLINEKEFLIKKLSKENTNYEYINYILYLLIIIILIISISIYRKQLLYKKRFKK